MKRTDKEINDHATEIARLRRIHAWHSMQANHHNNRALVLDKRQDARAGYARVRGEDHAAIAKAALDKLESKERAFNSPGVLTRLKRFLFNK